jgi:putative aldouronate transport system substrate-binding protein
MATAGDTPDLIEFPWQRHMGLLENMAEMEVIIELDGLINKSAPNLHSILQSNWEVKRQITSDNGHIYQIPGINLSDNRVTTGPVIRGDLLKKYGLNEPETIEDWERMLTAFKDRDATINPLSFDMSIFKESNSFISAFGIPYGFGVRDGKVFYAPIEDSYKEFLITFSRWYKEGLLDPEFILLRNSQLNDRVNSGKVGAFIGSVNNLRDSIDALKSIDPSFELIPVQNPVLQNVDALNIKSGIPTVTEFGIAIGSRNKYAEESMKWIDYAYSEEGYRLYNYGIEGYTYTVDNDQIQYTDINLNNTDSLSVNQAMDRYLRALPVVPGYRTDESIGKSYTYKEQKEAVGLWSANSGEYNPSLMPPVSLTQEESYELSTIMDNLSVYKEEMFAKYVIGAASLDLFDEYVETTKKIGIDQAIEIMQTALDRYNNRLPKLKVNGKIIETDTEPVVITKGETLLPIRFVIEGLGGSVAWHDKSKIVTGVLKDTVVTLKISSAEVLVDYEPKMLDTEIMAMNQRTYVHAIFIQEVLGVTINYDENSRTVTITSY